AIDARIPPYPLKAESRYPDKPYSAQGVDGGSLTSSSALGLDAFAQADGTPTNKPGQLTIGNITSSSSATVTDKDVALGTAVSAVNDVNVLGLIHIGSVTTRLTSSADGKNPNTTGTTTVAGLTIAGQSFGVDEKGLHAGPQNSPLPELTSPAELEKSLGISIKGLTQTQTKLGPRASRTASGLVIRIDTAVLKKALDPVINGVRPLYAQLMDALIPPADQGYFYYALNAAPSLTFVFGAGTTSSAATLPISFEFPPPPVFPVGPPSLGGVAAPPVSTGGLDLPSTTTNPTVVPPVLQPPGGSFTATGQATGFAGIGAGWLLGALLGSGLIGWVLMRFLGLAGGVLGFGCRLGAPTSVPDLRSVTA
ncbi:MAG: hypothetical protein JWM40_480, partial [Frankiales bacterium]|nr:hypothetical protein [Frankiales bacterium]